MNTIANPGLFPTANNHFLFFRLGPSARQEAHFNPPDNLRDVDRAGSHIGAGPIFAATVNLDIPI